eukprot:3228231-Amphidinium_carterae.2
MIPDVVGCSIQNVLNKTDQSRGIWTGRYLDAVPGSRSRSYGSSGGMTNEDAARHVFLWLWKQHTDKTGQTCPHNV